MGDPKIVRAVITFPKAAGMAALLSSDDCQAVVTATFGDGSEDRVLSSYADELTFTEDEFVGLTRREVMDLFTKKDVAYLRS